MTFRTKRLPFITRSRTLAKFHAKDKPDLFAQQFLESLKLFLCLLVIETFTFKLHLKATFLRLQNRYLAFRLRKTIKRKRDTLAEYLRKRNLFQRVSRNVNETHAVCHVPVGGGSEPPSS